MAVAQHGSVFDEDAIGKGFIRIRIGNFKAGSFQRLHILPMLMSGEIEIDLYSSASVVGRIRLRQTANERSVWLTHGFTALEIIDTGKSTRNYFRTPTS